MDSCSASSTRVRHPNVAVITHTWNRNRLIVTTRAQETTDTTHREHRVHVTPYADTFTVGIISDGTRHCGYQSHLLAYTSDCCHEPHL